MQVEKLFFYKIKLLRQKLGQVLQESALSRTTAAMVGKRLRFAGTCVSMAPAWTSLYRSFSSPVPPLETLAMPPPNLNAARPILLSLQPLAHASSNACPSLFSRRNSAPYKFILWFRVDSTDFLNCIALPLTSTNHIPHWSFVNVNQKNIKFWWWISQGRPRWCSPWSLSSKSSPSSLDSQLT